MIYFRLFYNLNITENVTITAGKTHYHSGKQISYQNSPQWFQAGPLSCDTSYIIKMTASSSEGESPPGTTEITTVCPKQTRTDLPPIMLYSMEETMKAFDVTISGIFLRDSENILMLNKTVKSFDFHFQEKLIFIVTDEVHVANIIQDKEEDLPRLSDLKTVDSVKIKLIETDIIESVSVDWLHNAVYFSVKSSSSIASWSFVYCDLTMDSCNQLNLHLSSQPQHFKVDPFNGFLYWTEEEEGKDTVYRSNLRPSHNCSSTSKELLYTDSQLGPFVVCYSHLSLMIPDINMNQMIQVNLDSKASEAVHVNYTSKVGWNDVWSIFQYEKDYERFYWSSSKGLNIEFQSKSDKGVTYSYSTIIPDIRLVDNIF